ncbi:MAG TPA: DNA polymerase III subunit delta [Anaeromyxobacteraceae bacterium]|nr:DNA polymerase III subunit delta [Anaeromyxobacteraceae bacterium]
MESFGKGRQRRGGSTLEECLLEARSGKAAPIYFFDGDPFLSARAARELANALLPEAERALNEASLDPAASPSEIAAELATPGLLGGASCRKVVFVADPAFLAPKGDGDAPFAAARDAWLKGRQREGARRLLVLAAKAGWKAEDLANAVPTTENWKEELGVSGADLSFVREAGRYAVEREMKAVRDDASVLSALLSRGLPPGHTLVVAAGRVDSQSPLVKKLASAGRRVTFAIEKAGASGEVQPVLRPLLDSFLKESGKSADPGAEARLVELLGDDARALANEVTKLISFAGDRMTITAADVDEVVTRVAPDPFFALGNAVEARDLARALAVLHRSLAEGAAPLMLLGSLASTVRRLLIERERGRRLAGDRHIPTFAQWQALILPHISQQELGGKKPYGFWMKYQAAQRYSRESLLRALVDLADADLAMKSGLEERPRLERVLWRLMAEERANTERSLR